MKSSKKYQKEIKSKSPSSGKSESPSSSVPTDRISSFISNHALLICSGLLFALAAFVYRDFIVFKKIFLFKDIGSDTLNGAYPFLKHIAAYIHNEGLPMWSFNIGMGQSLFPFFLLRGPFDLLLYLIGSDRLAYWIGSMEFLKVISGGVLFFLYLRTLSFRPFVCITGSLLFAFSGFMIVGGTWYNFSYEAVLMALLLLAFEKLYKENSFVLFPLAIALIGISMPFNLYVYGLFLGVYSVFRVLDEKGFKGNVFLGLISKMVLLGLLGMAISSFFLFENILQMLESPRGSGTTSYYNLLSSAPVFHFADQKNYLTVLFRFFSSDVLGTGSRFKGWVNYLEAPMFYIGLISLLLFTSVFQFLNFRRKIIYACFLGFWFFPIIFPYFRFAFWMFTGDYYRAFAFFVSFVLLFYSLQALDRIMQTFKLNLITLSITLVALLLLLSFPYKNNPVSAGSSLLLFIRVLLFVYAFLIYGIGSKAYQSVAQVLFLLVLCLELGYFSSISVNDRSHISNAEFKSKTGYNDYSIEAVASIKKQDPTFYRFHKDYGSSPAYLRSLNDGMVQDYFGTTAYNSFNQKYYTLFLQAIGLQDKNNELASRWSNGLETSLIAELIGSVKYFLTKGTDFPYNYDQYARFEDVKVLKNRYSLPLGFTYDKYMLRSDYDQLRMPQNNFTLLRAFFIGSDEEKEFAGLQKLRVQDTIASVNWEGIAQASSLLHQDTLAIDSFGQNFISGKILLNKKKLLFLSIPYDGGWSAKVDGKDYDLKIVDAGMTGILLDEGSHRIEMSFFPRFIKTGLLVSLAGLLVYALLFWWNQKRSGKQT